MSNSPKNNKSNKNSKSQPSVPAEKSGLPDLVASSIYPTEKADTKNTDPYFDIPLNQRLDRQTAEWILQNGDSFISCLTSLEIIGLQDLDWLKYEPDETDQISELRDELINLSRELDIISHKLSVSVDKNDYQETSKLVQSELKGTIEKLIEWLDSIHSINQEAVQQSIDDWQNNQNDIRPEISSETDLPNNGPIVAKVTPEKHLESMQRIYTFTRNGLKAGIFDLSQNLPKKVLNLNWLVYDNSGGSPLGSVYAKKASAVSVNESEFSAVLLKSMGLLINCNLNAKHELKEKLLNDEQTFEMPDGVFRRYKIFEKLNCAFNLFETARFVTNNNSSVTIILPISSLMLGPGARDVMDKNFQQMKHNFASMQEASRKLGYYYEVDMEDKGDSPALTCTIYCPGQESKEIARAELPPNEPTPPGEEVVSLISGDDIRESQLEFVRHTDVNGKKFNYKVETSFGAILSEEARSLFLSILKKVDHLMLMHPSFRIASVLAPRETDLDTQACFDKNNLVIKIFGDCHNKPWRLKEPCYKELWEPLEWETEDDIPNAPEVEDCFFANAVVDQASVCLRSETVTEDPESCSILGEILQLATPLSLAVDHCDALKHGDAFYYKVTLNLLKGLKESLQELKQRRPDTHLYFESYYLSQLKMPSSKDYTFSVKYFDEEGRQIATGLERNKSSKIQLFEHSPNLVGDTINIIQTALENIDPSVRSSFRTVDRALNNKGLEVCERLINAIIDSSSPSAGMDAYLDTVLRQSALVLKDCLVTIEEVHLNRTGDLPDPVIKIVDLDGP